MNTFSQKTIDFLIENKLRDNRTWFEENKEQYREQVLEPFAALVTALSPAVSGIDDRLICSPKVGGSISRIWRDTRFSKDKSLFRDHMWCSFVREKGKGLPELFFVLSLDGFAYGCGYYAASAASMDGLRGLIQNGDSDFKAALSAYENQKEFVIEGDRYKKSRFPNAPENLRDWLERKNICFIKNSADFGLLFSEKLPDILTSGFQKLSPIYSFLMKVEEQTQSLSF